MNGTFKIGIGFDAHSFTEGRDLLLGGVIIPHDRGLAGHSDADVLLHAVGDAILGALGKGDLGRHFPDSDDTFRGIASGEIISSITSMMKREGFRPANVDTVVIAQEPRLAPHAAAMTESIARLLELPPGNVGVKATTTEFMGFTGRGEGIAAMAVVLLHKEERSANE